MDVKFPHDLFRFLYWIYFQPFSFYTWVNQLDVGIGNVATILMPSYDRSTQSLKRPALFYVLIRPRLDRHLLAIRRQNGAAARPSFCTCKNPFGKDGQHNGSRSRNNLPNEGERVALSNPAPNKCHYTSAILTVFFVCLD
jgi:hypothetical protein